MILDVDSSTVISSHIIDSPILGAITPKELSGGVKVLILMLKDDSFVYNASNCGDNCAKWILKIAEQKDLVIYLRHIMHFKGNFEISGMEWIILDKLPDGYFAILNSFYGKTRMFDSDSSNWKESSLREELNTSFLEKINTPFDGNAVVEFDRNLLALDGQTEYGTCRDKISLLTVDEYRNK